MMIIITIYFASKAVMVANQILEVTNSKVQEVAQVKQNIPEARGNVVRAI